MSSNRASGILLHPTSLPGRFGTGDLGREAYRFADFLFDTKQRLWQVLPLGPTNRSGSPYQCLSAFAGNPLLINLEMLVEEHLLKPSDLKKAPAFPGKTVDFNVVRKFKLSLLKKSFEIFEKIATPAQRNRFNTFCKQKSSWLDDYALFMALQEAHGSASWYKWGADIRMRQPEAIRRWSKKLTHEIKCHKYQQYQFFSQWRRLKKYCNSRGIRLIGDMPIFVALDCDTVWSNPQMFCLDRQGKPNLVAGVPPDYFSKTGQLWGNPLYRWDVMEKDGYAWWIERLKATCSMVDFVRLDHFRGFEKYWEIPAGDKTARNGRWVPGPGAKMFEAIREALGHLPLIAEDLGLITPEVDALREQLGLLGMRVLQFAFGGDSPASPYLPHNYPRNCVVYTGTHDNNTTVGWFRDEEGKGNTLSKKARDKERQFALKYIGTDGSEINWDFIRLALMSVADTAIIPLQDVIGLGSEARMNRPATKKGNWDWRFTSDMLTDDMKDRLRELTLIYGRAQL
ncbi:MAG: 4-alpha-glucanotransferase [Chloroflexi bacterium RBG_13_52_14]|nr:MAG: 4-alpha-glucanotransferase [Chloroflexi bacterium RBG_13_52_14]